MNYSDDINKALLKFKRHTNAMSAEDARGKLDPAAYIVELIELKDQAARVLPEFLPNIKIQVDILNLLLKKCLPDLKQVETMSTDGREIPVLNVYSAKEKDADTDRLN